MAKRYHPDRNKSPEAKSKFIKINEAYEILQDKETYAWRYMQATFHKHAEARKRHEEKIRYAREKARERARAHAEMEYRSFRNSRIYRTAMVVNKVYDYIFLGLGFLMITMPVIAYFYIPTVDEYGREVYEFKVGPVICGVLFLFGIWYFLFKDRKSLKEGFRDNSA